MFPPPSGRALRGDWLKGPASPPEGPHHQLPSPAPTGPGHPGMSSAVRGYFPQKPSPGWKGRAFSRVILATRGPAGRNTRPGLWAVIWRPHVGWALHLNSTGTWLPVGLRQGLSARQATAGAADRQWPSPAGPESSSHSGPRASLSERLACASHGPQAPPPPPGPPSATCGGWGGRGGMVKATLAGTGESLPCHTDTELLWRCLSTSAPGTKADLQSNAECTRHVNGLPRDGRGAGSKARPRARADSGGVGHLFPAPTPFQGQRRKAANSLASAPQGPLGQDWQSRVRVGLCGWGGFLGEDGSGPPNRCPQGRPLQGGSWRTSRGTEGHRDRCVLGGPMSPGPWDQLAAGPCTHCPAFHSLGQGE